METPLKVSDLKSIPENMSRILMNSCVKNQTSEMVIAKIVEWKKQKGIKEI